MARAGQWEPLVAAVQLWLDRYAEQLMLWAEQTPEWAEEAQALKRALASVDPRAQIADWPDLAVHLAELQRQGHELKEAYLLNHGPTPLACLNAVPLLFENLYDRAQTGAAVFDEAFDVSAVPGLDALARDLIESLRKLAHPATTAA